MTDSPTDQELLRRYARDRSEPAFCSLVERHLNLVYGTALRGLNEPEAAADVTQNVFILLARKSQWLCGKSTLAPWLHHAVLLEVRQWWRGEFRRQRRETAAQERGTLMKDDDSLPQSLAGALDDGLEQLPETECSALLLRYFEGLSHREIGARLGTSEDAARMRVNKALDRLTQFFRLRGYTVPAAAATAAALSTAAKAAPAGLAVATSGAALKAVGPGALPFLKPLFARISGMSRIQTGALCVGLAIFPAIWPWQQQRTARNAVSEQQAQLAKLQDQQNQAAAELTQLQTESAQLDSSLADGRQNQTRYASAAAKLDTLKTRLQALLTNRDSRWPDDLPYVRVAKSEVASLDLLHKAGNFGSDGALKEATLEMLAITSAEKGPAEQALSEYQKGIEDLSNASAYQTNTITDTNGRIIAAVVVPPLGQPLKTLAANTASQLTTVLGQQREQLLFGDWDQGAIQLFSPGSLWLIADHSQVFNVWIQPNKATGTVDYGTGRYIIDGPGMSSDVHGDPNLSGVIPGDIFQKFFAPWLAQYQLTQHVSRPSEIPNE
jgi:RNA polymerase sigma factor (sigma-70 family)